MTLKKGQSYALDLGSSLVLFVILLGLFELYWVQTINQENSVDQLRLEANRISQQLTEQEGIPSDWNSSTVIYPGLSYERLLIDQNKLESLVQLGLNYSELKNLLDVRYEFFLTLNYSNGSVVNTLSGDAIVGSWPKYDSFAISQQTQTLYEEKRTILYVVAWR